MWAWGARVVFQQLLQRPAGRQNPLFMDSSERQDGLRKFIQCQRIFERGFCLGVFAIEQVTARE